MNEIEMRDKEQLFAGARINLHTFDNLLITQRDLSFLYLTSSTVQGGHLTEVFFRNAAFIGTKLIDVNFEECNLTSTDFCSIWAKNCTFRNSDLSDASISDSTFVDCVFENTFFNSVNLSNCQFENCTFEQFPIDESSVSLNTFSHCHFKHTNFTDSFYYQIFIDCDFTDVNVPANLLGYNFGFSPDVLSQLTNSIDLQEVERNFIDNNLFINAAILHINQTQDHYDTAMVACSKAIKHMIQNDIMIKSEEIQFLKNLTMYFEEKNQIAPISIIQIWQNLYELINGKLNNIAINKALPHVREYINMLYLNFQHFLERLQFQLSRLSDEQLNRDIVQLKIVYYEEPSFPLQTILYEITKLMGKDCPLPKLIRTQRGSFIEFIQVATVIIPYIQTFFSVLSVFVPIAIYYEEKKDRKKETVKDIVQTSKIEVLVSTTPNPSQILLPNSNRVEPSTNTTVSEILKVLAQCNIIDRDGFYGYNSRNVKSITVFFQ